MRLTAAEAAADIFNPAMLALVASIYAFMCRPKDVDARDKHGHDGANADAVGYS